MKLDISNSKYHSEIHLIFNIAAKSNLIGLSYLDVVLTLRDAYIEVNKNRFAIV